MEVSREYKQSDVGVIPADWEVRRLDSLGIGPTPAVKAGPFGSALTKDVYVPIGYKVYGQEQVIRGDHEFGHYFITAKKYRELASCAVRPGDVLLSLVGTAGRVLEIPSDALAGVINPRLIRFSLDRERVLPAFVRSLLESPRVQSMLARLAQGGTMGVLNAGALRPLCIQIPPLFEQDAIAAALGDVNALLDGLTRLIAKKRDLKQAAMQQLLTGQTRLPGFSAPWEMKRLQELGVWRGGMTPSMGNAAYWDSGSIPWIASGDVKTPVLSETALSITPAALHEGGAILVPANSVVLVTRSGILRRYLPVATNRIAMAINQDVKALTPAKWFHAAFILHTLTAHGDRILGSCLKSGTTVESIEFRWLKSFGVPVPTSIDEQFAIAAVLSDMDAEITALEARRDKTRLLKQAMMQELLTGRTRLV